MDFAKFNHYSALEFLCIASASNFQSFKCYCADSVILHDPTLITWQKEHGAQSLTGLETVFVLTMPSRNLDNDKIKGDTTFISHLLLWPESLVFQDRERNSSLHQFCNYSQGIFCDSHKASFSTNLTLPALTLALTSTNPKFCPVSDRLL